MSWRDDTIVAFPPWQKDEVVSPQSQQSAEPQGPATGGERTQAGVGGLNRGIAGLAGLPVDTVENIINLGIAAYGSAQQAMTGRPGPDLLQNSHGGSASIAALLERGGINTQNPRPDDAVSRGLYTGGLVAAGGGRRPVAPAVGAVVAQETLGPQYAGVGAMAPAAASQAALAARQAASGAMRPNVEAFKQAGTTPTVGQATESSFVRGLENLIAKFPGGVGVSRKFAENQQAQIGERARTGVSGEDAGRAIETGTQGFLARTKATWNQLDGKLAAKIGNQSLAPQNTAATLDELTRATPGAEKTTAALVNPKIAEIKANITADLQANNGVMPFEAVRALRSKVGSMLDESLVSGIPGGQLKKLYASLSKDMEVAAKQAGAGQDFARQNSFYAARMDRVENVLERVLGKTPEETFARFMPKDAEQANKVRAVMRSLDPEQRQIVSDAVVNRLGRATPGKQNDVGDVFSSETFLTNWNRLSPGAKAQLFPEPMRRNLDAVAKVSNNLREGSKTFANPSGTAGAAAPYGLGAMAATGNVLPAVGMIGSAYVGAKMLTNQNVVEWLAKAPTVKAESMAPHLARLGVIYNQSKDEALKQELHRFMSEAAQQAPQ